MIQGLAALNYPSYVFERWHGTLILYGIIFLSLFVNTYLARILPEIEAVVLLLHVIGFFVVLIPLVYLAPPGSAHSVFGTFTNDSGWSKGLSFCIGLATSMFSFIGRSQSCSPSGSISNQNQESTQRAIWVCLYIPSLEPQTYYC
jgi:choline transport protein